MSYLNIVCNDYKTIVPESVNTTKAIPKSRKFQIIVPESKPLKKTLSKDDSNFSLTSSSRNLKPITKNFDLLSDFFNREHLRNR